MGPASSKRKIFFGHGDNFEILLGKINYHEGNEVEGNIRFNCTKPIPP